MEQIIDDNIAINYLRPDKDELVHILTHVDTKCLCNMDISLIVSPTASRVWTSRFNAQFLKANNFKGTIYGMPLNEKFTVINGGENYTCTFLDSKYTLGSIAVLIQGRFGTVLYTGCFCLYPDFFKLPSIVPLIHRVNPLNTLYLDATYYEQPSDFWGLEDIIQKVVSLIKRSKNNKVYIYADKWTMDPIIYDLANRVKEKFYVDSARLETLLLIGGKDRYFTSDASESRIFIAKGYVQKKGSSQDIVIIFDRHPKYSVKFLNNGLNANKNVYYFHFYCHSNNVECCDIISRLKPESLVHIEPPSIDSTKLKFTPVSVNDLLAKNFSISSHDAPKSLVTNTSERREENQIKNVPTSNKFVKRVATKKPSAAAKMKKFTMPGLKSLLPKLVENNKPTDSDINPGFPIIESIISLANNYDCSSSDAMPESVNCDSNFVGTSSPVIDHAVPESEHQKLLSLNPAIPDSAQCSNVISTFSLPSSIDHVFPKSGIHKLLINPDICDTDDITVSRDVNVSHIGERALLCCGTESKRELNLNPDSYPEIHLCDVDDLNSSFNKLPGKSKPRESSPSLAQEVVTCESDLFNNSTEGSCSLFEDPLPPNSNNSRINLDMISKSPTCSTTWSKYVAAKKSYAILSTNPSSTVSTEGSSSSNNQPSVSLVPLNKLIKTISPTKTGKYVPSSPPLKTYKHSQLKKVLCLDEEVKSNKVSSSLGSQSDGVKPNHSPSCHTLSQVNQQQNIEPLEVPAISPVESTEIFSLKLNNDDVKITLLPNYPAPEIEEIPLSSYLDSTCQEKTDISSALKSCRIKIVPLRKKPFILGKFNYDNSANVCISPHMKPLSSGKYTILNKSCNRKSILISKNLLQSNICLRYANGGVKRRLQPPVLPSLESSITCNINNETNPLWANRPLYDDLVKRQDPSTEESVMEISCGKPEDQMPLLKPYYSGDSKKSSSKDGNNVMHFVANASLTSPSISKLPIYSRSASSVKQDHTYVKTLGSPKSNSKILDTIGSVTSQDKNDTISLLNQMHDVVNSSPMETILIEDDPEEELDRNLHKESLSIAENPSDREDPRILEIKRSPQTTEPSLQDCRTNSHHQLESETSDIDLKNRILCNQLCTDCSITLKRDEIEKYHFYSEYYGYYLPKYYGFTKFESRRRQDATLFNKNLELIRKLKNEIKRRKSRLLLNKTSYDKRSLSQ